MKKALLISLLLATCAGAQPTLEDRVREIELFLANEGYVPPALTDCITSPWSEWSACQNGSQSRTRTVLQEPLYGGAACGPLVETQSCSIPSAAKIPVYGSAVGSQQFRTGPADFIDPSTLPAPVPWTYFSGPNQQMAPFQNGVRPTKFRALHPWGNKNILYGQTGLLRNGRFEQYYAQAGDDFLAGIIPHLQANPPPAGPRGLAVVNPYVTWHGHPLDDPIAQANVRVPLYVGIRADGMLQGLMRDGEVKDLGQIPGTSGPHDFSYYFPNRKLFFIADTFNGRVLKVDRTAGEDPATWITTTYASNLGKVTSVRCLPSGTCYAASSDRGKIYSLAPPNGVVTELMNFTPSPFFIDYTSTGDLVVLDTLSGVYKFDPLASPPSKGSNLLASSPHSVLFGTVSVDRKGAVGPVDEFYVIRSHGAANTDAWQFRANGTDVRYVNAFLSQAIGNATVGDANYVNDPVGHYVWAGEVHPDQGLLLFQGFANAFPILYRASLPTDPAEEYDHVLFGHGRQIIRTGSVATTPIGTKPSFTALMNDAGWSLLGCSCDYIAEMPFAQQAAFVQGGMIGSFPRPEIVGKDLLAVLYFCNRSSQRYLREGAALTNNLRAWVAAQYPNYANTSAPATELGSDSFVYTETVVEGANLRVKFKSIYGWDVSPDAGLVVRVVLDKGMPSERVLGTVGSPWLLPKPADPGQHSLLVEVVSGAIKPYRHHATIY